MEIVKWLNRRGDLERIQAADVRLYEGMWCTGKFQR
jgi:hypothetical protein